MENPKDQKVRDVVLGEVRYSLYQLLNLNRRTDIKSQSLRLSMIERLLVDLEDLGIL
jgi:hypothetical protein